MEVDGWEEASEVNNVSAREASSSGLNSHLLLSSFASILHLDLPDWVR